MWKKNSMIDFLMIAMQWRYIHIFTDAMVQDAFIFLLLKFLNLIFFLFIKNTIKVYFPKEYTPYVCRVGSIIMTSQHTLIECSIPMSFYAVYKAEKQF